MSIFYWILFTLHLTLNVNYFHSWDQNALLGSAVTQGERWDIGTPICPIPARSATGSALSLPHGLQLLLPNRELCSPPRRTVRLWPWALPARAPGCLLCPRLAHVVQYREVSKGPRHAVAQVDSDVWGQATWCPAQHSQCHGVCFSQPLSAGQMRG